MKVKTNLILTIATLFFLFFSFASPAFATSPKIKCIIILRHKICFKIPPKKKPHINPRKFHPTPTILIPTITSSPTSTPTPTLTQTPTPIPTPIISDDFNDGNADGWWLGYSEHTPWINGNWRIEDGKLIQDMGGDDFIALVENVQFSDQTISTDVHINGPSGYGGIVFWLKDYENMMKVWLYPASGVSGQLIVSELVNDVWSSTEYPFSLPTLSYNLKIKANSSSGNVEIYVDNAYVLTHSIMSSIRTGQSGVINGNAGGYFDNFKITPL